MKAAQKLTAIACFALVALTATQASAETKFVGLGLKLHGSFASASYDKEEINDLVDSKLGYGGGLQFQVEFHKLFALQPELMFINKGHSFKTSGLINTDTTLSTSYAQLPILFVLQLPIPVVKPKLMAGPHLAYFITGTQTIDATVGGKETSNSVELTTDEVEGFDLGITAAAGVDIALDSYVLTVDLRWERGLLGVSAKDDSANDFVHTATSLNIGALFTF